MGKVYAADDPQRGHVTYRDRKLFWWSLSVVYPLLPFTGMAAHAWTGWQLALPHVRGDLDKVNIDPRKLDRILARYGAPRNSQLDAT